MARTFIIYADKRNTINALIKPLEHPINYDELSKYCKQLAKLNGPFQALYKTEAGEYYEEWYTHFAQETEGLEDETGTLNRFGDSVLKVAMLLALSEKPELNISIGAMREAVIQCEKLIGHARRVTMGKRGKSSYATQKEMILQKLYGRETHSITRTKLMEEMHYHLSADELDDIMNEFDQMNRIKMERHGSTIVYVMPEHIVTTLDDWFAGRNKR